ncbi:MAG: isoprenyl transferase [Bacteroidales bacterium]|nr:isoprenyl transferase [Bacteroidales bacterium]
MDKTLKHIAIIMDGNGRWAQQQGKERSFGHRQGVESVRSVVEGASEAGVPYLTLYAFSTENWNRPRQEIELLMQLLASAIENEVPSLKKNNVRLKTTGRMDTLPEVCRQSLMKAVEDTAGNTGLTLVLALSYSGRAELVDAAKNISRKVAEGTLSAEEITEETLSKNLYNPDIPDVDLMIRTGGDTRISNFLLWQLAYSELYFTPLMWPDFRKENLFEIIESFNKRERRFGKTGEQVRTQ